MIRSALRDDGCESIDQGRQIGAPDIATVNDSKGQDQTARRLRYHFIKLLRRANQTADRADCAPAAAGRIVLHAHDMLRNEHRSYRTDRISRARATARTFTPRNAIG